MKRKKNSAAQKLGRLGGEARNKKYTHEDFVRWGQMARGKKKIYLSYESMDNFLKSDKRRIQTRYPHVTDKMYDKYLFGFHVQYGCGVTPGGYVVYPWTKAKFKKFIVDQESEWSKNKKSK